MAESLATSLHRFLLQLPFVAKGAAWIFIGFALWYLFETLLPAQFAQLMQGNFISQFTLWHAELLDKTLLKLLPSEVIRNETLFTLATGTQLILIWSCTGLKLYFIITIAQLCHYGLKKKAIQPLLLSYTTLFTLNASRLYLLFVVNLYTPTHGDSAHYWLGKIATVALFITWYAYEIIHSKKKTTNNA